jgi:DNA-directed RNA polymerase specialized sigma24 family protein
MDDEAILAGLDREPDAFAVFFRRHFAALLEHFASRTRDRRLAADLCAETFATALADADRFDPARGLAVDWLHGIGQRLLDEAGRRGAVRGRARRRLGLAALEPGEGFVEALEEELVEAARFRARRRRNRLALPLPRVRALAVVAALTLVVAVLALGRDAGDRAASDGSATKQASFVVALAPMLSTAACRGLDIRGESAAEAAAALPRRRGPQQLSLLRADRHPHRPRARAHGRGVDRRHRARRRGSRDADRARPHRRRARRRQRLRGAAGRPVGNARPHRTRSSLGRRCRRWWRQSPAGWSVTSSAP